MVARKDRMDVCSTRKGRTCVVLGNEIAVNQSYIQRANEDAAMSKLGRPETAGPDGVLDDVVLRLALHTDGRPRLQQARATVLAGRRRCVAVIMLHQLGCS